MCMRIAAAAEADGDDYNDDDDDGVAVNLTKTLIHSINVPTRGVCW